MSEIILEDKKNTIPALLNALVYETDLLRKLNAVDTVLSALEPEIVEKTHAIDFKNWLNRNFLTNLQFMRQLKAYSAIISTPETCQEYFSTDYLTHPEYQFDEDFEKLLIKINRQINHFVGKLLKEFSKGDSINV